MTEVSQKFKVRSEDSLTRDMTGRIVKFLFLVLILGTISYLFAQNRDVVTVTYWFGKTWQSSLAVVLLVVFFLGALTTGCIAFFYGALWSFDDWRRNRNYKMLREHLDQIVSAREKIASGNYNDAKGILEKIVNKDPEDVVARVMLAETLRRQGDSLKALHILEEARANQQNNTELLFLAADINVELGNATAAHDNVSLVYKKDKYNVFALSRLVDVAESLGRFQEAIDYQTQLLRLSSSDQQPILQHKLAQLELAYALRTAGNNLAQRKSEIEGVLRHHREYAPALAELALLEFESKNLDAAVKLLVRAYSSSGDGAYLQKIALSCLQANEPEKALKAIRSALTGSRSDSANRLYLVALMLRLEMVDEAAQEIEALEKSQLSASTQLQLSLLKARIFERQNKSKEALALLSASLISAPSSDDYGNLQHNSSLALDSNSLAVMQLAGIPTDVLPAKLATA